MSLRKNFTLFCEEYARMRPSTTMIMDGKTFHIPRQNAMYPITLVTLSTAFFHFLLKPLGQLTFVSQMLGGIALGPSLLGLNEKMSRKMFPHKTTLVLNVFEAFGLLYMFFTLSVRMDISIIKKSGRLGIVIGVGSFLVPLIVSTFVALLLRKIFRLDEELRQSLLAVAILESSISFHVILSLLTDLKLLNSELGRLALSSSLINGLISWAFMSILCHLREIPKGTGFKHAYLLRNLSFIVLILIVIFVFRPAMFWLMNQTPEGKSLKQEHVLAINLMVMLCFLLGQVTGIIGFMVPVLMGIVTPSSPPMGSRLVDRIQYFVWSVFSPCFVLNIGRRVNLFSFRFDAFFAVELLILVATFVKTFAIIVPSLYYNMPFLDALSLGLVLNYRGIYDVQMFSRGNQHRALSRECFGIMTVTAAMKSAIVLPLFRIVHDSSRRYIAFRRRTIQHNGDHAELRILTCIHEPKHVPTIINLLQASNPPQSSIGVYVLNMEEYVESSLPLVIAHRLDKTIPSSKPTIVDLMIDAFRKYEQQSEFISVQCFTAIAPRASMHDDICSMAFQKCTALVIIPFQKTDSSFPRKMMKHVLEMAPCSVGILFDRGIFMDSRPIFTRRLKIHVCVLFLGGPDDREALAYGARMAKDCNIMLTILRFFSVDQTVTDLIKEKYDVNTINDFRISTIDNENVRYVKQTVKEGSDTFRVIHSIGKEFDLILVGRRHENDSTVLSGLAEWSEFEELGVIGDLLVSSDFKSNASVLVMQQQASVVEEMLESTKLISKQLK